jgi:hypothetical protein
VAFGIGAENFDDGVGAGLAEAEAYEGAEGAAALVEADEAALDDPDTAFGIGGGGGENFGGGDVFGETLGEALREIGGEFVLEFKEFGTFAVHAQVGDFDGKRADEDFFGGFGFRLDPLPVRETYRGAASAKEGGGECRKGEERFWHGGTLGRVGFLNKGGGRREKRRGLLWEDRARLLISLSRALAYLLQPSHSAHLSLQHSAHSLSLQHSWQLEPAAWMDATAATKAHAMAVMNFFMMFP